MADRPRDSLDLLQSVIDSAYDGLLVLDSDEELVACNHRFLEMLGIPESHYGKVDHEGMLKLAQKSFKDPEKTLKEIVERRANPRKRYSYSIELKDGSMIECFSIPSQKSGQYSGRVVNFRDVTAQRQADQKLRASEARFRTIFESAGFGLTVFDTQGNLLASNPMFCRMLGYTEDEIKKVGVLGISDPEEFAGENRVLLRQILEGKIDRFEIDKKYVRKDGSRFQGHLICNAVKDADGKIMYGIGMVIDVTERERIERQREEFIAIASHELRTPITPLKMQLQFLRRHLSEGKFSGIPDAGNILKLIQNSEQHLERLNRLVDDMLNTSQITRGKLSLNPELFNLSDLVRQVVSRHGEESARSGCQVALDLQPDVVGMWDRFRIDQVIVNLFTNAMKYGAGKPIELRTEKSGRSCRLVVRDHGIGIPLDQQARIFEQFHRVAPIQAYGGFGLGLFISREIIRAHNGSIQVESRPCDGATFTVELPIEVTQRDAAMR